MSTSLAIVFIIGKAAIWLALPAALGLWELRRHRRMMAAEARGEAPQPSIPAWLQAPRRTAPAAQPLAAQAAREPHPTAATDPHQPHAQGVRRAA